MFVALGKEFDMKNNENISVIYNFILQTLAAGSIVNSLDALS